jgi:hypothetical protein
MLKKFLIFFGVILMLGGCYGNKKPEKPANLISKEDMVNILIDIKIVTSATGTNRLVLENSGINPKTYIYKKYQIDSLQFAQSNEYYAFYTDQYDVIYTKVNDSLKELKEIYKEINKRELEEKRVQDSIARLEKIRPEKILDSLIIDDIDIEAELELITPVSDTDALSQ